MKTNFRREFVTTEGFRRIADASKEEQLELDRLRAEGVLPDIPPCPSSIVDGRMSFNGVIRRPKSVWKILPTAKGVQKTSDIRRGSNPNDAGRVLAGPANGSVRSGGARRTSIESAMKSASRRYDRVRWGLSDKESSGDTVRIEGNEDLACHNSLEVQAEDVRAARNIWRGADRERPSCVGQDEFEYDHGNNSDGLGVVRSGLHRSATANDSVSHV